jgi:penicillin-binding protein 2
MKKSYEIKEIFSKTNTIEIGSYKDGKYDTIAVQGEDINLTLDAELQGMGIND